MTTEGTIWDMHKPKLSVILPTYNRAPYLTRMLDSVLTQKFTEFELLLLNNGSTDEKTEGICLSYADKDERIRFFSLPDNQGPAPARNLGIREARAPYMIHVDDDDYCESDHFDLLYELITKYNADIAISGCADEFEDEIRTKHQYEGVYVWDQAELVSEFLKRDKFHAAPATKMYRTSLFEHVKYPTGVLVDDIHVTYRLIASCNKGVAHGRPTYRFFKHGENTTSFLETNHIWPDLLQEYLVMQSERVKYISERVPEEAAHVRYAAWSYMISMVEKIHLGRGPGCERQLQYMIDELYRNQKEFMEAPWFSEREHRLMRQFILF
ncbi:glycosyltransferase family 2 protein [Gorillibacterium sp. CAU 1737]|uniref:glycosyltransferase family 2 protein n=1 Tax=Gorillibacterium sp. CAU 1737 TaxID=3140362 RepID=UPI0032602B39